jgi:hypothetical protein
VLNFLTSGDKVTAIDLIAEPERVARLDIVIL